MLTLTWVIIFARLIKSNFLAKFTNIQEWFCVLLGIIFLRKTLSKKCQNTKLGWQKMWENRKCFLTLFCMKAFLPFLFFHECHPTPFYVMVIHFFQASEFNFFRDTFIAAQVWGFHCTFCTETQNISRKCSFVRYLKTHFFSFFIILVVKSSRNNKGPSQDVWIFTFIPCKPCTFNLT